MSLSVISSRANPRVKQLRAAFAGQARLSGGLVAVEGEHLVFEAKRSGMVFKTIFLSEGTDAPEWMPRSVEVVTLSEEVFGSVVDTRAPQGIAALLVPPTWDLEAVLGGGSGSASVLLFLVAAGLQDPGNLGTLVRSAEAFGACAVVATPGTVSAWNQKALRASAGSVFRMPVVAAGVSELTALKARGVRLYGAAAEGEESMSPGEVDLAGACGLMIGNEGAGLGEEFLQLADGLVSIAMVGPVESLNAAVAGSVLLYEASRQRGGMHRK